MILTHTTDNPNKLLDEFIFNGVYPISVTSNDENIVFVHLLESEDKDFCLGIIDKHDPTPINVKTQEDYFLYLELRIVMLELGI